ncbi:MAG: ribosome recycling factor [Gammaproteobacteria bacterium]|nr:ribosome recycling factor [Gammaproteobacteria bacterium]
MIDEIQKHTQERMRKSTDSLKHELSRVRTGRASANLLDHVMVEYYGNSVPINQTATVAVEDARTISITPWENSLIPVIEKAIMSSDLGLNPTTAGTVIRVIVPPLTEERRKSLIRMVEGEAEKSRVAIRNIRRDANTDLKELLKEKEITEDESHHAQAEIQKLTDQYVGEIDLILQQKEKDLMTV